MRKKKDARGGQRKGAGAPLKYGEATKNVTFRCPVSKVEELKNIVNAKLSKWQNTSK